MSTGPQLNRKFSSPRWQKLTRPQRASLRSLVADLGWQQAAKRIGVSENTIRDLESGGLCRVDAVERVAKGLEKT